jgi:general secretion pathway protein H
MLTLAVGDYLTPTLAASQSALPPEGAGLAWGGPARRLILPARNVLSRGFTLLELLVVLAIIAIATAGTTLALRDNSVTALEREAQRLAAVLEAGRSQSRTTGLMVGWQASDEGFTLSEDTVPAATATQAWLTPGITVQTSNNRSSVILGPEPIIAAQSITLFLEGRRIQITTDGLRPFRIQTGDAVPEVNPL